MSCTTQYFGGASECGQLLKNMTGFVLQEKGSTWTDATIVSLSAWHTAIADDDSAVRSALPLPFLYFTNTTDEPEITTAPNTNVKSKGNDPVPSGIAYLQSGLESYVQMHGLKGGTYEAFPFFEDGTFWATRKASGALKGFRLTVDTNAGLPVDDKNNSYPFYAFFQSYSEFENIVQVSDVGFSYDDLLNYVPVGLSARVTTAYTAGDVVIQVNKLGSGDPMLGLVVGDFEVMKSNATPTVVATVLADNGLGSYTITIKKDNDGTPANLAATDYVILQIHDDDATYFTYMSQPLKLWGGA